MLYTINKFNNVMNSAKKFFCIGVLGILGLPHASAVSIGVNAGVSTKETTSQVQAKFSSFAALASKQLKEPVDIYPILSSDVETLLASQKHELMIVHTHIALKAAKQQKWRLVFLTQDTKDNQIHFLVRAVDKDKKMTDIGSQRWVFPGKSSFATAAARGEIARMGVSVSEKNTTFTTHQDALTFYLQNNFADIAVTRVSKIAQDWKNAGGGVINISANLPVYAVLAAPGTSDVRLDMLSGALQQAVTNESLKAAHIERFQKAEPNDVSLAAQRLGM